MKLALFDYHLPASRIAQRPLRRRDASRLLVFDREGKTTTHRHFFDLPLYLKKGDVLVFNNSKVFPARLWGKKETGGKLEVFLLRKVKGKLWEALIGGKRRKEGTILSFSHNLNCTLVRRTEDVWHVHFNKTGPAFDRIIQTIGSTPTPPYIKRKATESEYQTVYAHERKIGSVAAPTAGFHFTKHLLQTLKRKGIQTEFVTLHVGLGTFAPVKTKRIEDHTMHPEFAEVDAKTIKRILRAKKDGHRIIAVGTTSVRVLETVLQKNRKTGFRGWINTFIYPGYRFKMVDGMITNFHLPKSTLLMLVSAFAGRTNILHLYRSALRKKYRFYSFGDAMLILAT